MHGGGRGAQGAAPTTATTHDAVRPAAHLKCLLPSRVIEIILALPANDERLVPPVSCGDFSATAQGGRPGCRETAHTCYGHLLRLQLARENWAGAQQHKQQREAAEGPLMLSCDSFAHLCHL